MKKLFYRFIALTLLLVTLLDVPCAVAEDDPYASRGAPNPIPVLSMDEIPPTLEGVHHYMLICIDEWDAKADDIGHTDGMVLLTVDTVERRVMLTSFIRDMLIQRPDGEFGRLNNVAMYFGANQAGIEALVNTINTHFALRIEKYIVVDFRQVERIVDAVGGVDITITDSEAEYLKNYRISASSTTPAIAYGGTYHFSGHAAVIYMRIRKRKTISGATQDVGRTERARTVLSTIADSLKDVTYEDAVRLMDVVLENTVLTNMTAADMTEALTIALDLKGTPVEGIRMPIDGTYELWPVAHMATQQIDFVKNRQALDEFLFGGFTVRTGSED